ncbi:MAG: HAMP domain-containing histidine kinase [Clostridia bacterium]|nr:HAMP domain-containing histidine kinase [Clostridia bacterium]
MEISSKNKINLSSSSMTKQLVGILILVSVYILVGFLITNYNVREPSNLPFISSTNTVSLNSIDFNDKNEVYLANHWILVPNTEYCDFYNGAKQEVKTYSDFPHFENVSINSEGWNNLGKDAFAVDSASMDNVKTATYIINLTANKSNSSLYINIPAIDGFGLAYINGELIGKIGYDSAKKQPLFDFTGGDLNIDFSTASENTELLIVIYSEGYIRKSGLTSYPAIGNFVSNNRFSVLKNAWFFFELAVFLLSIVGAVILSFTFRYKSKMVLFVFVSVVMLLYICVDNRYFCSDPSMRNYILFMLLTLHGILSYAFTSSIFSYMTQNLSPLVRWHDSIFIALVGFFLILPQEIKPSKLSNYSDFTSITVFLIIISLLGLIKTIYAIYKCTSNEKNAVMGMFTSTSMCFVYLYMTVSNMYTYYIPVYSVYFAISLVSMQLIFVVYYVIQFRELAITSQNLQSLVEIRTEQLSKTNKELLDTNAQLLENELARKNVMSNISHDLKTPITAIKGYAQLLLTNRENISDDQARSYADNILKRTNQMERLIADIIEVTKLQSGSISFKMMPISLAQMLEETYYMYDADVSLHGKKMDLFIPDKDSLMVEADPNKLVRIFENLISNAIHYTREKGSIHVKAYRTYHNSSDKIVVEVSDNGIGIPAEDVSHIFDRFYRAKNSGVNIKGTGLGLAIVKLIADKHNAEIVVESEVDVGTTFKIIFNPYIDEEAIEEELNENS